ncbi:hypothetical protein D3C71_2094290 [compost metagenome]
MPTAFGLLRPNDGGAVYMRNTEPPRRSAEALATRFAINQDAGRTKNASVAAETLCQTCSNRYGGSFSVPMSTARKFKFREGKA